MRAWRSRRSARQSWKYGPSFSPQIRSAGHRRAVQRLARAAGLLRPFDFFAIQPASFRPLSASHADPAGTQSRAELLDLFAHDLRWIAGGRLSCDVSRRVSAEADRERALVPAGIALARGRVVALLNHFEKRSAEHALGLRAIELRQQDRL